MSRRRSEAQLRMAASVAFLRELVHDLKQPLNLARVVAQDVRLDVRKGRLQVESLPDSMLEIEEAVDRAAARLEQIGKFASKVEGADHGEPTTVQDVCRAAVERARAVWPGLQIVEHYADGPLSPAGDPFDLEQAAWELLDNAARAAHDGSGAEPRVEIRVEQRETHARVMVVDSGDGIPDAVRDVLFEPFVTTSETAAGLGLTLARALTRRVAGRIGVSTEARAGNAVELFWPLAPTS